MKIYDVEGFPNPARVRIALAEKGVTDKVEFIPVDVMGGEHRSPEFLARNPDATVPCAELPCGTTLSQCTAITEYIDNTYDGPALCGTSAKERGVVHMMNLRAEAGLVDAVGAYFHHATAGLGPQLEIDQLPEWGRRQYGRAQSTMRYLDSVLAEQHYLAGANFSMADITGFAGLAFADFAGVAIPDGLDNLAAWRDRVAARPSCSG